MSPQAVAYQFEDYQLLTEERLLLRNGSVVPLKPKVFDTLLALVRSRGQLVSKSELMDQIWGDSFVEEGNLTQYIFTLRKIFGENPSDHRFIVTVPGHGYSFVAKVRETTDEKDEPHASHGSGSNGHGRSLAVLPLKLLVPDTEPEKEYLGLAIADSLITQLNSSHKAPICPTEAILKYVESDMDAVAIGRELAVDRVVSGTIQRFNGTVRANIQLHNVKSGSLMWASKFEVRSGDFFELQDSISEQVTNALTPKLNERHQVKKALKDPDNFQSFLRARFFWESRTEEGLLRGLEGAREVVAKEPDFALGHIGVADSFLLLGHHLFLPPATVYPAVREAIEKALELDPDLAEAYASLADHYFMTKNWAESEKMYQRAIRMKPDYASAQHWYGWYLMSVGRFDDSLVQIEQAQALDPNSIYLGMVRGVPFFYKRMYDQAIRQFRLILDIHPNYSRARYYLGLTLLYAGDHAAGIDELEKVVMVEPIQQAFALLGYCYGVAGRRDDARRILQTLDRFEKQRYVSPYVRAWTLMGLGDVDATLTQLERAAEENSVWLIWLKVDRQFEPIRNEPRFQRVLSRLKFPST